MDILRDKRGFTLLEVIVVIIVIGILASLALPRINGIFETARSREAINMLSEIYRSEQRFSQAAGVNVYTNNAGTVANPFLDINPIPPLANFVNPPAFVVTSPANVSYTRTSTGPAYTIWIDLNSVPANATITGRIRCSSDAAGANMGAAPCPDMGFAAADGVLIQ